MHKGGGEVERARGRSVYDLTVTNEAAKLSALSTAAKQPANAYTDENILIFDNNSYVATGWRGLTTDDTRCQ